MREGEFKKKRRKEYHFYKNAHPKTLQTHIHFCAHALAISCTSGDGRRRMPLYENGKMLKREKGGG